jgi:hypothetical protein
VLPKEGKEDRHRQAVDRIMDRVGNLYIAFIKYQVTGKLTRFLILRFLWKEG